MSNLGREAWLNEAAALILDAVIMPVAWMHTRPTVRLSIGFPKGGSGVIAECWRTEASADGVNEIFVTPEIDNSHVICTALVHELIHAVDDCASGHRNFFARTARAAGLEGRLTSTVAGPELTETLFTFVKALGGIPHAKLDYNKRGKKDKCRQLKIECESCGAVWRMSKKWGVIADRCPCCNSHQLTKHV